MPSSTSSSASTCHGTCSWWPAPSSSALRCSPTRDSAAGSPCPGSPSQPGSTCSTSRRSRRRPPPRGSWISARSSACGTPRYRSRHCGSAARPDAETRPALTRMPDEPRRSMATRELRFVPLLGTLFVALVAVAYLVAGDAPSHHAEGAEIRADYDNETTHQIAAFLGALGAVPLLFFAGYLRAVLRRLHPSGRLSANVALAAAAVVATGLTVQSLIHAALAEASQTPEFSDQALQALNALNGWSLYPIAIGLSTLLLASGVALLRGRRFFAPFVAWAAVVLGVLALVPIVGFFAAILSGIWVVVISLMLFARSEAVDRLWDGAGPAEPPQTRT